MLVTVKGKYRHDLPEHTEQGLKDYEVSFPADPKKETPKTILEKAAIHVRLKDGSFDSFKTHQISWGEDVKPEPKSVEPAAESAKDSGFDPATGENKSAGAN